MRDVRALRAFAERPWEVLDLGKAEYWVRAKAEIALPGRCGLPRNRASRFSRLDPAGHRRKNDVPISTTTSRSRSSYDVSERPAPVEALHAFAAVAEPRHLRWYVFGVQAVIAYGRPRMTADLDV